jgi:hypothetical protein
MEKVAGRNLESFLFAKPILYELVELYGATPVPLSPFYIHKSVLFGPNWKLRLKFSKSIE